MEQYYCIIHQGYVSIELVDHVLDEKQRTCICIFCANDQPNCEFEIKREISFNPFQRGSNIEIFL